jgi:2-haloalkanoic acid dehalogenase type II
VTLSTHPTPARFDAVIFDLLTALLNSWTLWNAVAGSDAAGLRWRRKYLDLTYGAGAYRPYERIIAEAARLADIPDGAAAALIERWPGLEPWPEAPGVLATLAGRVPLAVATNSSDRLAGAAVAATGGRFAAVVTAEAAGFYKPRPEPYRRVLEMLGTEAARTLFVAGSAADVPGAGGVGMPVYWHNRMGLPPVDGRFKPIATEVSLTPLLDLV